MNVRKRATPDHPIHELIAERWSPYAFADRPVSDGDLRSLFEAARWAASSYNEQPWRYILATKANPAEFEQLLSCLVEGNRVWARNAPVLAIGCTRLRFALNDKPNAAAVHDLGLASATLTLEASDGPRPMRPSDDRHPAGQGAPDLSRAGRRSASDRAGHRIYR